MVDRAFACFPRLPLEIRNMIWVEAANHPRNLDIWAQPTGNMVYWDLDINNQRVVKTHDTFRFKTRQPIPELLTATKESRAATKDYFQVSFGIYEGM